MKLSLVLLFTFSNLVLAASYNPKDFIESSPKTTVMEKEEMAPAMRNKTGVKNGISAEDVNTSPTKAPTTDKEVIEGSVLSNEDVSPENVFNKEEIEAQEEKKEIRKTAPIKGPDVPEMD